MEPHRLEHWLNLIEGKLDEILGWVNQSRRHRPIRLRLIVCHIHQKRTTPMPGPVVTLRNTEVAVMHLLYDYTDSTGKLVPIDEAGVVPVVTIDHPEFVTAILRSDNLTVDVASVDGAVGTAIATVAATLPDGKVLTQTQEFDVVAPEADAIALTVDAPTPKVPAAPPAPAPQARRSS